MDIRIINANRDAFNTALAAARTCYSGKNILPDDCINFKSGKDLLLNIFKAGHHTVFQHTTFTLHISNVSRHIVWRLLHSHQHYNSEQISQRYVDGNKMSFVKIPCDSDNTERHDNISYNKKIMEHLSASAICSSSKFVNSFHLCLFCSAYLKPSIDCLKTSSNALESPILT